MLARLFRLNRSQLISHGAALISPRGPNKAGGRQRKQAANEGNDALVAAETSNVSGTRGLRVGVASCQ